MAFAFCIFGDELAMGESIDVWLCLCMLGVDIKIVSVARSAVCHKLSILAATVHTEKELTVCFLTIHFVCSASLCLHDMYSNHNVSVARNI